MNQELDNKLYELQRACNRCADTEPLADWVLYAASRYIATGRATRAFERAFLAYPDECWPEMIRACLRGDKSDDGIMKTMRARLQRTC